MDDLLQQGITVFRAGQRDEARKLFIKAVTQNSESERTWGWMYNVANNDKERIHCLKQMLRINPKNEKASQLLSDLTDVPLPSASNNQQVSKSLINQQTSNQLMKKCPYCAEEIQQAAVVCRFCGHNLYSDEPRPVNNYVQPVQERSLPSSKLKKTNIRLILVVAIIIICLALPYLGKLFLGSSTPVVSVQPTSTQSVIVNTGIKRSSIQPVFEDKFKILFDRVPENRGGQPSLSAKSADGLTEIELYGPSDDLITAGIWILVYDNASSSELSLYREYFITFLKSAIPDWSDSENWFDANYSSGLADKNYGNLKISLSAIEASDGRILLLSIERIDRIK